MAQPGHQQQVLLGGEQLVDRGELPGQPDRGTHAVRVGEQVAARDPGAARVRAEQGGEDVHEGGLACPVRAEQA
jgi:hypothetical protein